MIPLPYGRGIVWEFLMAILLTVTHGFGVAYVSGSARYPAGYLEFGVYSLQNQWFLGYLLKSI